MMRTAIETEADAATFDLEDSVAPHAKSAVREEVSRFLAEATPEGNPRFGVWINPLAMGGTDDLDAIVDGDREPDYLVVPMINRRAMSVR